MELYKSELDISQKHKYIQQAGDKWLKKLPKEKQRLVSGVDGLQEHRNGINIDEGDYNVINKLVAKKYDYEYNRRKNSE